MFIYQRKWGMVNRYLGGKKINNVTATPMIHINDLYSFIVELECIIL